jgi:small-conductance mechanosensitive channel
MDKTIQFYNDIVQYFKTNYINLGLTLLFIIVGFLIANFVKRRVRKRLANKSPNHITSTFISQIISFVIKTIVILISLYLLGLDSFTNKILAGAGLLTFVIGFALKDIGENFLAGIILAFKSPFKLDDLIEVNDIIGFVKDISIRETLIKTPDGKDVFLPNAIILKNPLQNYTIDGFLRYEFVVGIAYENDATKAINLIFDELIKIEGVLQGDKKPSVTINELATNTINIQVQFWVDTFKTTRSSEHRTIRSQVMNDVVALLVANEYSLPASIIEVKNYGSNDTLNVKLDKND